jgi:hypothetical protein
LLIAAAAIAAIIAVFLTYHFNRKAPPGFHADFGPCSNKLARGTSRRYGAVT